MGILINHTCSQNSPVIVFHMNFTFSKLNTFSQGSWMSQVDIGKFLQSPRSSEEFPTLWKYWKIILFICFTWKEGNDDGRKNRKESVKRKKRNLTELRSVLGIGIYSNENTKFQVSLVFNTWIWRDCEDQYLYHLGRTPRSLYHTIPEK